MQLDYKGMKSTRLRFGLLVFVVATIMLAINKLTGAEWVGLAQWIAGIYAASEVGAKGASAYAAKPPGGSAR